LNQATLFYKIAINKGKFDVGKDFYDVKLIPITKFLDDDVAQPTQLEGRGVKRVVNE